MPKQQTKSHNHENIHNAKANNIQHHITYNKKETLILNRNKEMTKTNLLIHGISDIAVISFITLTRTIIMIHIRKSGGNTKTLDPLNHPILLDVLDRI
jgi:hypothetical protein